jgi:integrase
MAKAPRGKLTDRFIEALAFPKQGETIIRDGAIPGLMIRVGKKKKSWELRIEKQPRVNKNLGDFLVVKEAEARAKALDICARHSRGEAIEGPKRDQVTIANAWPVHREALQRRVQVDRSQRTVEGYDHAFNRLSERIKHTPLRDLGADPMMMLNEIERIRDTRGESAAKATARFVRALFRFWQKRDPTLVGTPVSAVDTTITKRDDLPVLSAVQLPGWWKEVQALPNPIRREAHLFCLLSGLRRNTLLKLEWEYLDVKNRVIRIPTPKGGRKRTFDLILTKPMLRCLWRARQAGRMLYPEQAQRWVFPSGRTNSGHVEGLEKDPISATNHALRRTYATLAAEADVDHDTIGRLLNHGGTSITSHYIRTSALGRLLPAAQETISAHIMESLGAR